MSTATTVVPTLDISGTRPIPFWRLVLVELRKSYDTRAGFWLLFTIGLLIALAAGRLSSWRSSLQDYAVTFTDFTGNVWLVSLVLLPMLAILLVTSEWTPAHRDGDLRHRAAPAARDPRQARRSAVLLALAAVVLMFVAGHAVHRDRRPARDPKRTTWAIEAEFVVRRLPLTVLVAMVFGFAVACMLLNTPGGDRALLPLLVCLDRHLRRHRRADPGFDDVLPWLDFQINVLVLADGLPDDGEDWGQLLVVSGCLDRAAARASACGGSSTPR